MFKSNKLNWLEYINTYENHRRKATDHLIEELKKGSSIYIQDKNGFSSLVHKSTKENVEFQLTYFDRNKEPYGHNCFVEHTGRDSKKEQIRRLQSYLFHNRNKLKILKLKQ